MDIGRLFDVRGKIALVTGASGGIGFMIAEALVRAGSVVFICSRKRGDIEAAAAKLSSLGPCTAIAADLARADGIAAVAASIGTSARLDILVNNAGRTWGAPIDAFPRDGFEKVLALNLIGPFELVRALLPQLRAAASADDPARIINIASIEAMRVPQWENYAYSASKAGLVMLTRHLAARLAPENIAVNAIAPGVFRSRMTGTVLDFEDAAALADVASPLGRRIGTPEDIAGGVLYLASRAGAWLTGVTIPIAGGHATVN